ncbi:hypothetical protein SORBI_3002G095800 [Sorghum bicolor]|uniref:Homologous recombination OB-fold protein OB-fold domain-containing protein n=1 Tax=Sorghum bicolor TaxID=4558 RepID=A0A1W0W313_SORBI|nr:hypothetical protein SORBI_3002G095800 [Sorghum bicolor]
MLLSVFVGLDAGKDRAWERPGIRAIKGDEDLLRAPLVAGVVTSCKPNGLGDLFLILKDPTDSIGASVHKKVLLEENNGHDISIGCAVVFSKVAIFRPSHTKLCYLNVTKGKVVKVFSKDCAAPAKQVISSSTTERSQGGDSTSNIMMKIFGRGDMMPSNNEITVTKVSHEHHATPDSSNSASTWDISGGFSVRSNQEGKLLVGDPHKHMSSCSTDGHTPKENVNTSSESLLKRKRAVSEWTEEQLSELSVDY